MSEEINESVYSGIFYKLYYITITGKFVTVRKNWSKFDIFSVS